MRKSLCRWLQDSRRVNCSCRTVIIHWLLCEWMLCNCWVASYKYLFSPGMHSGNVWTTICRDFPFLRASSSWYDLKEMMWVDGLITEGWSVDAWRTCSHRTSIIYRTMKNEVYDWAKRHVKSFLWRFHDDLRILCILSVPFVIILWTTITGQGTINHTCSRKLSQSTPMGAVLTINNLWSSNRSPRWS